MNQLNKKSYLYRYKNLDTTTFYATKALILSDNYPNGKAEAMNNIAFTHISKMAYTQAELLLDSIYKITDNQIELLIADIQHMRLCQRESKNKDFYTYRENAILKIARIKEAREELTQRQKDRLIYAESEFAIVSATYYYYVGLIPQAQEAIAQIDIQGEIQKDTAQLLNYLYYIGSGGIINEKDKETIAQREFEELMHCYSLAKFKGYTYWEANSLQAISEHLIEKTQRQRLIKDNLPAFTMLNPENLPDSLLARNLALRSLQLFTKYGDVYQRTGSYRTLASCYWELEDYPNALYCLQNAIHQDTVIYRAPDLIASIYEQMCLVYSAMNNKIESDKYRNLYLDAQESTRQDRQLEARAETLYKTLRKQKILILLVVGMIIVVLILLLIFNKMKQRQHSKLSLEKLLLPLQNWEKANLKHLETIKEEIEEIEEQKHVEELSLTRTKQINITQRAKITLASTIIPLIERLRLEFHLLSSRNESKEIRDERLAYATLLIEQIELYNNRLTQWIQMKRGEISLHIENVSLQELFEIIAKRKSRLASNGITLNIKPTDSVVKADKALTLFMLNTLMDNARRYTPKGGSISLDVIEKDNYVDISIEDTGKGISKDKLSQLFNKKILISQKHEDKESYGFGLINCKGIMDKYKKISRIFNSCDIWAESIPGKGSTFSFRLPKGIKYIFIALSFFTPASIHSNTATLKQKISILSDSVYNNNIRGEYNKALQYVDSCIIYINECYLTSNPNSQALMKYYAKKSTNVAELLWIKNKIKIDYKSILEIRNEAAIAALALHNWELYHYNNSIYTQLFKIYYADNTLAEYCATMQRSSTNNNIAVVILIILLFMIFPLYYILYYRHIIVYRKYSNKIREINTIIKRSKTAKTTLQQIERKLVDFNKETNTGKELYLFNDAILNIKSVLTKNIEIDKKYNTNIQDVKETLTQISYERDLLHVNNNILDNSLSTLKHETMYFPSRIKQILSENKDNIQELCETTDYYELLYTSLCTQASKQVNRVKLKYKTYPLIHFITYIDEQNNDYKVLGDKDMLNFFFYILNQKLKDKITEIHVETKGKYIIINMNLNKNVFTDQICRELFTPITTDIQYYICSQILRDMGEHTNMRAVGIKAYNTEKCTNISITMVQGGQPNKDKIWINLM